MKESGGGDRLRKPKLRLSTVRLARMTRRGQHPNLTVRKALADPWFPVTFFIRNLRALRKETAWRCLPFRSQRNQILRMIQERSRFFLEVKEWLARMHALPPGADAPPAPADQCDPSSYCTHCGGCCEFASGLPEFPSASPLPPHWRVVFGQGLGKGHRFCPFVWEFGCSGGSRCAIHPWRPVPCRRFEQEECDFLQQDPDTARLSHTLEIRKGYRLLLQLMRARRLPLPPRHRHEHFSDDGEGCKPVAFN